MKAGITNWIDYLVIGIYFFFVIIVGMSTWFRKNRESVQGYFLAGRTMTWLPIGASLFASNIGSEHFIGLAGSGAASGIGVVMFEWGAVILLILLGWVFLPIYLSAGVFTMPEYLGARFGGQRMRLYLACVAMFLYVVTKISVDMYAGVFFIQMATGIDQYLGMAVLLGVTVLYTIAGGLAAVVFTDALQTVVMLVGAVTLSVMAFVKIDGLGGLYAKYPHAFASTPEVGNGTAMVDYLSNVTTGGSTLTPYLSTNVSFMTTNINSNCSIPRDDAFHIFRDPIKSDLPWPGVVFRATFASLWNWCADQVIVQRALAAKNMANAKGSTLVAGYLKFTPLFLIIFPGMISRVLYPDEIGCVTKESCLDQCGNEAGCSNSAYPALILNIAPVGMKGLLMAVMIAALMSSLTSIFNSAVTVFTMDLYRKGRPRASERELLLVGRLFVIVLVGISIAWLPFVKGSQEGQLFMYIQAVTGYIAPPISAIFLLAVFYPRINETGAFWGVICGQIVGIIRFVLDFVYPSPGCDQEDTRPSIVADVHFTYFSIIVFMVTLIVTLTLSWLTPPQPMFKLKNLTFWTISSSSNRGKTMDETSLQDYNHKQKLADSGESSFPNDKYSDSVQDENFTNNDIKNTKLYENPKIKDDRGICDSTNTDTGERKFTEVFSRYIPPKLSLFLNLNAGILLATLVFLCAIFH